MKATKQELIDLMNFAKENHNIILEYTSKFLVNEYLNECRAVGSNEQAEEACGCSIKAVDKGNLVLINICDKHKDIDGLTEIA